jgi:fructose-1,6-bisphosphatase/inositol monophosphatase family enzyme
MASGLGDWSAALFEQVVHGAGIRLRTWADGYGYALVATGRAEAMVDLTISVWDVAGMPVILDEAGGRFSDLEGRVRVDSGSALGSNGLLHDDLLAVLR